MFPLLDFFFLTKNICQMEAAKALSTLGVRSLPDFSLYRSITSQCVGTALQSVAVFYAGIPKPAGRKRSGQME